MTRLRNTCTLRQLNSEAMRQVVSWLDPTLGSGLRLLQKGSNYCTSEILHAQTLPHINATCTSSQLTVSLSIFTSSWDQHGHMWLDSWTRTQFILQQGHTHHIMTFQVFSRYLRYCYGDSATLSHAKSFQFLLNCEIHVKSGTKTLGSRLCTFEMPDSLQSTWTHSSLDGTSLASG